MLTFRINVTGILEIGDDFSSNTGFLISCGEHISFGNSCLLGWNVLLIDGDGHTVFHNGKVMTSTRPIHIGEHCWIGANCSILKGVCIADNTIVPLGSVLHKSCDDPSVIFNNKILKTDISWQK